MRKKSKYKPKGLRYDNLTYVLGGMAKVSDVPHGGVTLKIKNHNALANITQGNGKRDDVDMLISAMNIAEALAINGVGRDWWPEIQEAQNCILKMAQRGLAKGDKFLLYGEEMKSLNLGMDIHDAQLDACTVKELETAIAMVENEIKNKRARMIAEQEAEVASGRV